MKPRKVDMVEVDLLDFMKNCKRLIKEAMGTNAGESTNGLARWKYVVIHCYRLEDDHSYRETENRLRCFSELREILELDLSDVPDYSTIYKSFDRLEMRVWRALLRVSAEQHPQSGHVALDSTFFERGHASSYYLQRSDRDVQTLKVITITDTELLAVLDLQCSVEWKHDTKLGPQVVRRNTDDLLSVSADKGFQDWMSKFEFYTLDVDPLVLKRGSSPETVGHNALIRDAGYSQRWMSETSYSTTKRSLGSAVRAQFWYHEFREIVLMFAISNIEQLCEPL
jgi:IS5 family transposase